MPAAMRYQILQMIEQHEATGNSGQINDIQIADVLGTDIISVQRQLLILENRGLVDLAKVMGSSLSARMNARGMEALEAARAQTKPGVRHSIEF